MLVGIDEARATIKLNPNHATIVGMAGLVIGMCGEMEEGVETIQNVMRLNPFYATWLVSLECLERYMKGDNEKVLALADKFTLNDWPGRPLFRTVALAQLGRIDEAAAGLEELREIEPDFARDPEPYIRRRVLFDDQASYVIDGLRKAGM